MPFTTELLYLNGIYQFDGKANLLSIRSDENKSYLVLDRTIFYPQSGEHPWDVGTISIKNQPYSIKKVLIRDGIVHHYGNFADVKVEPTQEAILTIDANRRHLHARLHTSGHFVHCLVTTLVKSLGSPHYPDSPYVQFNDDGSTSIEELERELIALLKKEGSIQRDIKTQYATYEELKALLSGAPPNTKSPNNIDK